MERNRRERRGREERIEEERRKGGLACARRGVDRKEGNDGMGERMMRGRGWEKGKEKRGRVEENRRKMMRGRGWGKGKERRGRVRGREEGEKEKVKEGERGRK